MREEAIINKIRAGDAAGLEGLMDRYLPYVSAVVWHILRGAMPAEDGEEIVSDVFLAAWNRPEALRPGSVKAWLGAVARNKAKNRLRQISQTLPLEEDALDIPGPDDPPGEYGRWNGSRSVRRWTPCPGRTGKSSCATTTTPRQCRRLPTKWDSMSPP